MSARPVDRRTRSPSRPCAPRTRRCGSRTSCSKTKSRVSKACLFGRPQSRASPQAWRPQPTRQDPSAAIGAKPDRDRVTRDVILTVEVPEGSRFKGYETLLVRDLALSAEVLRYRRERWVTPAGESIVAPVPTGTVGGYGANLRRFCLVLHAQGQVTTERLTAILNGIGVEISKRQVVRLLTANLDTFVEEDRQVLRAGLQSAPFITVGDTNARHARRDGVTTQIGGARFTVFRTGWSKSRQSFLSLLRAGYEDYLINAEALRYMHERQLAGPVIEMLRAHPVRSFPNEAAWRAHLSALGIDALSATPPAVTIATEGALWGAICHHGLLNHTVIVSDDAGQFRLGAHALCRVGGDVAIPAPQLGRIEA